MTVASAVLFFDQQPVFDRDASASWRQPHRGMPEERPGKFSAAAALFRRAATGSEVDPLVLQRVACRRTGQPHVRPAARPPDRIATTTTQLENVHQHRSAGRRESDPSGRSSGAGAAVWLLRPAGPAGTSDPRRPLAAWRLGLSNSTTWPTATGSMALALSDGPGRFRCIRVHRVYARYSGPATQSR